MIETTILTGWIQGFEVATAGRGNMEATHLQYADDTLIFCGAKEDQYRYLRIILVLCEGVSGQHINWRKSIISHQ